MIDPWAEFHQTTNKFCSPSAPLRSAVTSEFHTLVSTRKSGISCGLWLLRAALPVWKEAATAGGGELVLLFSALLSLAFAFSCVGGRKAHRLMLFARPSIMHEMIHNLLSLVYHLQHINNESWPLAFFQCASAVNPIPAIEAKWFIFTLETKLLRTALLRERFLVLSYFVDKQFYLLLWTSTSGHLLSLKMEQDCWNPVSVARIYP